MDCTYKVTWSEEEQLYVGTCDEFPDLRSTDEDRDFALDAIKGMVEIELLLEEDFDSVMAELEELDDSLADPSLT